MIEQILNRQFVLEQLGEIERQLAREVAGGDRRDGGEIADEARELEPGDLEAALAAVRDAGASEGAASSGQPGFEAPGAERRGEEPAPIDDHSFLSRDPTLSNVQSALEAFFEDRAPELVERQRPGDRRRGGEPESPVTDLRIRGYRPRRSPDGRRLFDQFSVTDARWVASLVAMGVRRFRSKYPFNPEPATPRPIAERCRIVLAGDWGSGLPRARKVAELMRRELDAARDEGVERHAVHLGDVYYSGWKREYKKRFLEPWPVRTAEAGEVTSWSTNGNHDMYAGGHAYYRVLMEDERFAGHEGSSLFSLANRHWRLLGIDTAWEDHALVEPQPEWIRREAEAAAAAGQRTVLLSHHQPFSAFEGGSGDNAVLTALRDTLAAGLIHGWFWGHEHRCAIYRDHEGLPFGCCLGHGGVPVYQWRKEDAPPKEPWVDYEYRGRFKSGLEWWANFGFAVLDLDGPAATVRYIDENGQQHRVEKLGERP